MKGKIVVSLIIIIIIISIFSFSQAASDFTNATYYFKDTGRGILAYKQINAFKLVLADGSTLADASISTNSDVEIIEELKQVEIVFVIDTSGSMRGTRKEVTRTSTKTLVNALYEKLGSDNLKIGVIYFNSGMDTNKLLELTNDKNTVLNHIDKIYASGGTRMADSLEKAKSMLSENNSEDVIKIVCTLSDGALGDQSASINKFKEINSAGISTISIFVETSITSAFQALENENPNYHKNMHTSTANLANTIVDDIYHEIYMKIILMSDPKVKYNISNAGIIAGDDKIIMQVDEEILHGATLKVEYIVSITSSFNSKNIQIYDYYTEPLIFNQSEVLLTENKTNGYYGWKIQDGKLMNDSGSSVISGGTEYKVKLVLSTVLTPMTLYNLNRIENYVTFKLTNAENGEAYIINKNSNGDLEETNIKALDILIIPPTGTLFSENRISWSLNIIIAIISMLLIIICIRDYIKNKKT